MAKGNKNTEDSFAGKIGTNASESQPDKPTILRRHRGKQD
jgi:hypothetical protein